MAKFTAEKAFKHIGLLLIFAGIATIVYTIGLGVETSAQAKWPTVEGELHRAEFQQVTERWRDDPEAPGGKREIYNWIPDFEYSYIVDGQQYTSTRISTFNPVCKTESDVMDLRRLILRNNAILVYYDPQNPAFSVINPFPSLINIWISLIVAVVAGLTGLAMFIVCRNA